MQKQVARAIWALGVAHIIFGMFRFEGPLSDAISAGFVGQFKEPEIRRTAFWFLLAGPMLMLIGHLAIRAANAGDKDALKVIGLYALGMSVIGVLAFPASPLWAPLVLAVLLLIGSNWPERR